MNAPKKSDSGFTSKTVESNYYVLGGGSVGVEIASRLHADNHAVTVVGESHNLSEPHGFQGNPEDVNVLKAAGIEDASTVIVATPSDSRNLLIAQLVRAKFEIPVVVRVNNPDRIELFAEAGHKPVCAASALSAALINTQ